MAYRRIPTLNWLRVFEAAGQTRSFKSAAQVLNMTPSAVSQQISSLEHYLGKKLFIRKAKGVELTEEGLLFLPVVRDSLSAIEINAGLFFGSEDAEQLTIEAPSAVLLGWLNAILPDFQVEHPEIGLRVMSADYNHIVGQTGSDVVIFHGQSIVRNRELIPIIQEYFEPVAHPTIARQITEPRQLFNHCLIDGEGQRLAWRLVISELGLDVLTSPSKPNVTASDTTQALSLAASGIGIALARTPTSKNLVSCLGLEPCLENVRVRSHARYYLALRPIESRRPIEMAFESWLLGEAEKLKG